MCRLSVVHELSTVVDIWLDWVSDAYSTLLAQSSQGLLKISVQQMPFVAAANAQINNGL